MLMLLDTAGHGGQVPDPDGARASVLQASFVASDTNSPATRRKRKKKKMDSSRRTLQRTGSVKARAPFCSQAVEMIRHLRMQPLGGNMLVVGGFIEPLIA